MTVKLRVFFSGVVYLNPRDNRDEGWSAICVDTKDFDRQLNPEHQHHPVLMFYNKNFHECSGVDIRSTAESELKIWHLDQKLLKLEWNGDALSGAVSVDHSAGQAPSRPVPYNAAEMKQWHWVYPSFGQGSDQNNWVRAKLAAGLDEIDQQTWAGKVSSVMHFAGGKMEPVSFGKNPLPYLLSCPGRDPQAYASVVMWECELPERDGSFLRIYDANQGADNALCLQPQTVGSDEIIELWYMNIEHTTAFELKPHILDPTIHSLPDGSPYLEQGIFLNLMDNPPQPYVAPTSTTNDRYPLLENRKELCQHPKLKFLFFNLGRGHAGQLQPCSPNSGGP